DFMPDLYRHLLSYILSRQEDKMFSLDKIYSLYIRKDRLYKHKVLCVNYTTYNVQRAQDLLNLCTHTNVILLSGKTDNLFVYT
ncbi:uncharacterized protein FOMMEDRAFT_91663, partial [Fomitiporia mediterranea MF3/22]|uniref:uncharacterized protein n=1 Tax=Fomitiporia mediterranea (strain MF3/22) TaxID=694068 RepID=UPI0004409219